ncbi:MAG: hypothetical protein K2G47_02250 [Muribaculum sp.]|nr:hypothetical protein [Muribaculum sp.]
MPSISEILDSVSVPALIKDEVIRNGNFDNSSRGVIYYSGGFTVVFPVHANGQKWAFRCWHTEMGNVRKRFKTISDYINQLNSSYFCKFYYCDSGLIVDGKVFPTTRMDWVNGKTINQYIIENANDKELMLSLANKFLMMTDTLHKHHIAHGDLQHGNIIITNAGEIKLVDYDSLFVPGLEGESDIITGKAEFQHPKRKQVKIISEKIDYFSELTIYLSIIAIAYQPSLIERFSIEDSLLFQSSDWNDIKGSDIYKTLKAIGNDDISLLLDVLVDYLKEDNINNLIPFSKIWRNLLKKPVIHSFLCGEVDGIAFRGLETPISWDAENVSKVTLDSVELACNQRTHIIEFTDDTDIVLVIRNGLHSVEQKKHIKVVDAPKISFFVGKRKLKRRDNGVESSMLRWDVTNAHSVILRCHNTVLSTDKTSSELLINPTEDTVYELIAIGLDGKTEFKSEIQVVVRNPAKIEFQSDKMYTLPGVPISISWSIKHARLVKLNGKEVPIQGKTSFSPNTDEEYTLSVTDDFGETSKTLKIRMLPLPVVESVLVGMPDINQTTNILYETPHFESISNIPVLNTDFITLEVPKIPDLKNDGLFVELESPPHINLTKRISMFIKNILRK